MTRPILWALGTLASAALASTMASDRLAARFGLASPSAGAALTTTDGSASTLTVSADLQGHFVVHPTLDGRRVRMLVDTGATVVALSHGDARLAGIQVASRDFTRKMFTANGTVHVAPVRIKEIRVGEIAVRDVEAVVLPEGRLHTSLLGMSFLRQIRGFEISQGRLMLRGS
jgi:aspartyl protease family protein